MDKNSLTSMAIPAIGVSLGAFLLVYLARDALLTEKVEPCSSRYTASATEYSLQNDAGAPLSPIELQARAGVYEWGVLERGEVIAASGGPAPLALKIRLPKGSTSMYPDEGDRGGLSFRWQPSDIDGATSVCLSYSVFLPGDFNFGSGGELPGIFGGQTYEPKATPDGENGFALRLKWSEDGKGNFAMQVPPLKGANGPFQMDLGSFIIPRGQWVSIEQEIGLNAVDKADGIARLWIDGALTVDRSRIVWRTAPALSVSGAVHDVWYGGINSSSVAPEDTSILITPLSLRWIDAEKAVN